LNHPFTLFDSAQILKSPVIDGIIGVDVLKRFRVTFDYGRGRLYLMPNSSYEEPFLAESSGLRLTAVAPDFHRIKVDGIISDSPAAKLGIQPGDILTKINGTSADALTLPEVRAMFQIPNRKYSLSFAWNSEN
jgi:membrane-associated protease RseP (regulator of RpoE activity)